MASVRLYLLAVGAGIGLIAGAMVWVAAPPPTLSNSELAAAARDRLGMVDPAALPRPAAESVPESPPAAAAAAAAAEPAPAPAPAPEKVTPTEVLLYVSEGENAVQVVDQLVQAGLVGDAAAFTRRLVDLDYDGRIQAGAYHLWRGISEADLAERLVHLP